MKVFFVRIIFFLVGGVGIFFLPWATLVVGGLFFSLFVLFPIEVLLLAFAFELLSGITPGLVSFPLASAMTLQHIAKDRIDIHSFLAKMSLWMLGVVFFLVLRGLLMVLFFGYPVYGGIRFFISF